MRQIVKSSRFSFVNHLNIMVFHVPPQEDPAFQACIEEACRGSAGSEEAEATTEDAEQMIDD